MLLPVAILLLKSVKRSPQKAKWKGHNGLRPHILACWEHDSGTGDGENEDSGEDLDMCYCFGGGGAYITYEC